MNIVTQSVTGGRLRSTLLFASLAASILLQACSSYGDGYKSEDKSINVSAAKDPNTTAVVAVDRFSKNAGHLMVRTVDNGLPGANEPINFDAGPFITKGLSAKGGRVAYYNFDVQPTVPAPIYALFRQGEDAPVEGQLNVIDVLPGQAGYNDFWHVQKVTVPANYQANTVTSLAEILEANYSIEPTNILVNCPVVPEGSTAKHRVGGGNTNLQSGWYQGKIVKYFTFEEKALSAVGSEVPISPIYVSFNINPGQPDGGVASGFKADSRGQTHNVVQTIPTDSDYSPLWLVNVYDNANWSQVYNLDSVLGANIIAAGIATVNCPIVKM